MCVYIVYIQSSRDLDSSVLGDSTKQHVYRQSKRVSLCLVNTRTKSAYVRRAKAATNRMSDNLKCDMSNQSYRTSARAIRDPRALPYRIYSYMIAQLYFLENDRDVCVRDPSPRNYSGAVGLLRARVLVCVCVSCKFKSRKSIAIARAFTQRPNSDRGGAHTTHMPIATM